MEKRQKEVSVCPCEIYFKLCRMSSFLGDFLDLELNGSALFLHC